MTVRWGMWARLRFTNNFGDRRFAGLLGVTKGKRKMGINQHRKLLALGCAFALGHLASIDRCSGQDQTSNENDATTPAKVARPARNELRDKQIDVSFEARDIERVLLKLKKASELAKTRITEAATTTESVTTLINKGETKAAKTEANQANEKLREIIKQLETLLKEDAPQQVADARQLATELSKLEREFAETFEGALNPIVSSSGKVKVDPKSETPPESTPDSKGSGGKGKGEMSEGDRRELQRDAAKNNPAEKSSDGKSSDGKDKSTAGDKPDPDGADGGTDDLKKPGKLGAKEVVEKNPGGAGGKQTDAKKPGDAGGKETEDKNPGGAGAKEDDEKNPGGTGGTETDEKNTGGAGGNEADAKNPGGDEKERGNSQPGDDQDSADGTGKKPAPGKKEGESGKRGSSDDSPKGAEGSSGGGDKKSESKNGRGASGMTAEQLREAVARRADKLTQTGKTLQDVLTTVARSDDPAAKETVARIQAILKEMDINKMVEQMDGVGALIRSGKNSDAKMSSLDLAERFEIMAQRLDAAYRSIVAPQAEELRKLEAAVIDLRERLKELETPSQVSSWHREARELLDKLDKLGVGAEARTLLEKEMKAAGFAVDQSTARAAVNWAFNNDYYLPPNGYDVVLLNLQEEVQIRIQTLLLGDFGNNSDDATPPKYQEFVDRYYKVLSGDRSDQTEMSKSKFPMKRK